MTEPPQRNADAANALRLIARVRSGRLKNNLDVMALCNALANALNLGDICAPERPAPRLLRKDPREYYKLYMRWWRHHGQAGEGRQEA